MKKVRVPSGSKYKGRINAFFHYNENVFLKTIFETCFGIYQSKVKPYDIAQPFTCTTYSYCVGIQVRNEGEQDDRKVINQKSEPLGHKNIIKRTFILFSPFMNEIEALVFIQPPTYR